MFFAIHDPTTKDRQGHDVGTQYRSVIFAQDDAQRAAAEAIVRKLDAERIFAAPIVTEIAGARDLLAGRALPPGLLRGEPRAAVLHGRRRAEGREVPHASSSGG